MKITVLGGDGSIGSRHIKNLTELGHDVRKWDVISHHISVREEMIEWADAVVIATPTNYHGVDITSCDVLCKPMFVEKPMVDTDEYMARVPLNHIKMVGYNLRFHSCVKKAKEWMGTGAIGKPLWARFTCAQFNDRPQYLRDGVILNWSHEIDLAIYLLGVAEHITTVVNGNEDRATMILQHTRTDCSTSIYLDYLTKPEKRGFLISGEDGTIMCDLVQRTIWIKKDNKVVEMYSGRDSWDGNYLDEMRKFIDRLNGKEVIGCTAAEALIVNGICLEAKRNAHVR